MDHLTLNDALSQPGPMQCSRHRPGWRDSLRSAPVCRCQLPNRRGRGSIAIKQVCDQRGPASLMTRADTRAVIAMEVLVEEEVIMPMRITLHQFDTTEYGPNSVLVFQEDRGQTP